MQLWCSESITRQALSSRSRSGRSLGGLRSPALRFDDGCMMFRLRLWSWGLGQVRRVCVGWRDAHDAALQVLVPGGVPSAPVRESLFPTALELRLDGGAFSSYQPRVFDGESFSRLKRQTTEPNSLRRRPIICWFAAVGFGTSE